MLIVWAHYSTAELEILSIERESRQANIPCEKYLKIHEMFLAVYD